MKMHISYKNIDTTIEIIPTSKTIKKYFRSLNGKKVSRKRILIFDSNLRDEELLKKENLNELLRDKDCDVDIEVAGKIINKSIRIIVDKDMKPVYSYREYEILIQPDGTRKEKIHSIRYPNLNEEFPVKISDKLIDPIDIVKNYIISHSFFITHTDGVTYKFLYEIAKNLSNEKKFARLISYDPISKKPSPLILREGGKPFAGIFLEGRIKGDEYCLILHLSEQELKKPVSLERMEEKNNENSK